MFCYPSCGWVACACVVCYFTTGCDLLCFLMYCLPCCLLRWMPYLPLYLDSRFGLVSCCLPFTYLPHPADCNLPATFSLRLFSVPCLPLIVLIYWFLPTLPFPFPLLLQQHSPHSFYHMPTCRSCSVSSACRVLLVLCLYALPTCRFDFTFPGLFGPLYIATTYHLPSHACGLVLPFPTLLPF